MRLRTHLISSAVLGLLCYPRSPKQALLVTVAGVAVDLDHFALYALRSGDWNPLGAFAYDRRRARPIRPGDTKPRYGSLRSIIHRGALTLPLLWLAAQRWPWLRPIAIGVTLHLMLDLPLQTFDWRARLRARGHCERCGVADLDVGVFYLKMPRFGGLVWAADDVAVWCRRCAREAKRHDWA